MENYPNLKIIYDRRQVSNKNKEGTVEIEIYFQSKRKWISTGVKILPSYWNPSRKRIEKRSDSVELNDRINNLYVQIEKFIHKLIITETPFSWLLMNQFLSNKKEEDSFIKFVSHLIDTRNDISEGTRRNHRKFYKALLEFGLIKNFQDLTKLNVINYDDWLHTRKTILQSTVACYHKYLKIYVNEALRRELITKNPYDGIKIEKGKSTKRKFLTQEEIRKICSVNLKTSSLIKVRDLFIFQIFTGLAYADLKRFDFKNVIERNGRYLLLDQRQKTGEDYYIVFLPPAVKILKDYNYQLPLMSLEQYNMRLKIVGDAAGIDKSLTSHMGRHTYATQCLNSGISIEVLAKMMGHADIRTTQIYAKLVNPTIEAAYSHLEKIIMEDIKND